MIKPCQNLDKLFEILTEALNLPKELIDIDSSVANVKSWDSLATISLITSLEAKFSISIQIEEIEYIVSTKAIVELLKLKGVIFNI